MITVTQNRNESFDSLLRRFNNAVIQDGILKDFKDRSVFYKPSAKKRKKAKERINAKNLK